ncbi:MAG: potassium-transporting ATPase subunit C [Rikenellaceae bacterium]
MKNLLISLKITVTFCIILFCGYVLVLWGIAALSTANHGQAEILSLNGKVVGAANVGQSFTLANYFWSRPSAVDYNGSGSGASNKGVSNIDYLNDVSARIDTFLIAHPYLKRSQVPSEMVTASGSGLDPHISVAAALAQAERVAIARKADLTTIKQLIETHSEKPLVGMTVINVTKLNIALDEKFDN